MKREKKMQRKALHLFSIRKRQSVVMIDNHYFLIT